MKAFAHILSSGPRGKIRFRKWVEKVFTIPVLFFNEKTWVQRYHADANSPLIVSSLGSAESPRSDNREWRTSIAWSSEQA